jgi:hypothetical protein
VPGHLLHEGAIVQCAHFPGEANPTQTDRRVKVSGQNIVTQPSSYAIRRCGEPPPTAGNGPCIAAIWTGAATRVRASGQPVLLTDSPAYCVPTGTGLNVVATQTRVKGA